jgi:hypothetical protein
MSARGHDLFSGTTGNLFGKTEKYHEKSSTGKQNLYRKSPTSNMTFCHFITVVADIYVHFYGLLYRCPLILEPRKY